MVDIGDVGPGRPTAERAREVPAEDSNIAGLHVVADELNRPGPPFAGRCAAPGQDRNGTEGRGEGLRLDRPGDPLYPKVATRAPDRVGGKGASKLADPPE